MGGKHKAIPGTLTTVEGPWSASILVCRKCGKKLDGGFGPNRGKSLPATLKQIVRDRGLRKSVRVIPVGCLDICPRDGVVVVAGDRPGHMSIVPKGLCDDAIVEQLIEPALTRATTPGS